MLDKNNNSSYTISVDLAVNAISGVNPEKPSLYQQTADYFRNEPANKKKLTQLKTEMREVKSSLHTHLGKNSRLLEQQLEQLSKKYNVEYLSQQTHRTLRLNDAIDTTSIRHCCLN